MAFLQTSCLLLLAVVSVGYANLILRGNVAALTEDENGGLLNRQLVIPPPASHGRTDHPHSEVIPGSLLNPYSINFNDRHEYVIGGIRYLAILANSSLLILRDEGDRTAYHHLEPYPEGCKATYIQPGYPEGVFYVGFQHPCLPLYANANYDEFYQEDSPQLEGKKVIVLEGLDIYQERNTFLTYVGDTGNLVFQYDGADSEVASSIGSCSSMLQDLHPFSTRSASGNLEVIVDCLGDNSEKLRYIAFIHNNGSVVRVIRVTPASGTPLSDGGQYIAVIHEDRHFISLTDVNGDRSLPPAKEHFDTAVTQVKFLTSENFTKLVVYRVGEDIMLIDIPEFVASNAGRGKEEQHNTTIRSCDPACPPVEIMGDRFVMMVVLNSMSFYEIVYQPLDLDSTTEPIRVERVASQPVILSFTQTGLDIVSSPTDSLPTDSEITTTSTDGLQTDSGITAATTDGPQTDSGITTATTDGLTTLRPGSAESAITSGDKIATTGPPQPISNTLMLVLVIVITTVTVTPCIVLGILASILLKKRASRRKEKNTKSLENGTAMVTSTLTMTAPKLCLARSCICWSSVYQQTTTTGLQETGQPDSTQPQPNGLPLPIEERSQFHPIPATTATNFCTQPVLPGIQVQGPETQETHILLLRPPSQTSSDSAYTTTTCASTPTLTPDASPRSSIRNRNDNRGTSNSST